MKKLFTLLTAVCVGTFTFGQTVFQSNLSSWSSGDPTDFMNNTSNNITSANVIEKTGLAVYGTSQASLINTSPTSHKRFSTQPVTVVGGETYLIEMWVAAGQGDLRTGWYDVTNGAYNPSYNPYIDVAAASGGNVTLISQTVTVPATCVSAEFILSLRNTDPATAPAPFELGIIVDSVAISVTTPPVANNKSIYEIQYTTAPSGDSPEMGNVVTTKGVITGIMQFGSSEHSFFIQDSALAWNGLYVYHTNDSTLAIGDSVEVTGTVSEFNNLTELTSVTNINVLSTGNALPTAVANTTLSGNMEEWEGVLIKVTNAQCTSNSVGFGMWELNDGSGVLLADDDIFPYAATAIVGTNYDVTGIGHYSFGDFKILPRDINDISTTTGISETNKKSFAVYPNPVVNVINFETETNGFSVQIIDITGKEVKTGNTVNSKLSISTSNLSNGIYFYSIIDNGGNVLTTNKFVVTK